MRAEIIKKELNTYLPLLSAKQQQLILDMIKNILQIDSNEKRISTARYNDELESAFAEVKKSKGIQHKNVVSQSKKWIKRK